MSARQLQEGVNRLCATHAEEDIISILDTLKIVGITNTEKSDMHMHCLSILN